MPQSFNGVTYYRNSRGYFVTPLRKYGKIKRMHRDVWEHYNGPIPSNHDIHHIDGNKGNNEIENLQLTKHRDHSKIFKHDHPKQQKHDPNKLVTWECACCHINLRIPIRFASYKKYCSDACTVKAARDSKKYFGEFLCVVCGKTYMREKYRPGIVCSSDCATILLTLKLIP